MLSMLVVALQVCAGDLNPVLQLNLLHSPVACAIPSIVNHKNVCVLDALDLAWLAIVHMSLFH